MIESNHTEFHLIMFVIFRDMASDMKKMLTFALKRTATPKHFKQSEKNDHGHDAQVIQIHHIVLFNTVDLVSDWKKMDVPLISGVSTLMKTLQSGYICRGLKLSILTST